MTCVYGRVLVGLIILAGLVACHGRSSLSNLDRDVQRILAQRQDQALRDPSLRDTTTLPPADAPVPDLNENLAVPDTTNPALDQLDARRDPRLSDPADVDVEQIPTHYVPEGTTPIELDLPRLLALAIEQSPEYRSEKESLFLSVIALIVERHLWGPRFFNTVSTRISGTPEDGDHDQTATIINDFTVTQRLPYGGSVAASAIVDYVSYLKRASTTTSDNAQSATLELSFDLPLLRGAGVVAREDRIQAERNVIYAVRDFERFRRSFLVDLSQTYFDLLRRQRQIENQRVQLRNLRRLAMRFEALADAGREPRFEAERARQSVLFQRSNLLNAIDTYASSLDSLKVRLGIDTRTPLIIKPADIDVPEPALDPVRAVKTGLANRLDLQNTRDRVADAERSVRVARNQLLPDLDLSGQVNLQTDPNDDSPGASLSLEDSSYRFGARLDVPLDRQAELGRYRSRLIEQQRSARDYQIARNRVAQQVRSSVRNINQARFSLELQKRNVNIAQRRTIGVQLRERTLGPRDVIEAQEDLLEARNRVDAALADLQNNILNYLLDTGQMRVTSEGKWAAPSKLTSPAQPPAHKDNEPTQQDVPKDESL